MLYNNYSPLEQFQIYFIKISNFTNYFLIFLLLIWIIISIFNQLLFTFNLKKINLIYLWKKLLFFLIWNLLKENCYNFRKYLLYVLYMVYIYVSIINLIGLIPYNYTLSSHIFFTLTFSLFLFLSINIFLVINWGFKGLNLFFPAGVSFLISPLLILIEIISYIGRLISLSVRLFANMLSGHALVKILIYNFWLVFILILFKINIISILIFFIVLIFIMILESAVGILQSYVFTMMALLYYNDSLEFH